LTRHRVTRHFLDVMIREVGAVQTRGRDAFDACHAALYERTGGSDPRALPAVDVSRLWTSCPGSNGR
jgi:hypothetical protein